MELKEFIRLTLIDIVEGVEEAKKTLDEHEKYICPPMGSAFAKDFGAKLNSVNNMYYQEIEFDVAVSVENKTEAGLKGAVKVFGVFELGGGGNGGLNNVIVNRIKFHVPLALLSGRGKIEKQDG